MYSKIKLWAIGLLTGLAGFFYIMAESRKSQRDKASTQRDIAKRNTETLNVINEQSETISKKLNEARHRNAEVDQDEQSKTKTQRRSGSFGSYVDRMRDDSTD